jgi:LuxR family maltose regulon positive regulatory protein
MQDLITAKFDPPMWMGDQIRRDLLMGRLHGALTHRLTLVHAPAGYGKTSLLSQWRDSLSAEAASVAWLTLERDDRDLKRFVKYLLLAIRRERGDDEAKTGSSDLPPRAALSAIVNELGERAMPVVLILDDLHHAFSEPVGQFLESLVRLAPPNCHFLFASRDYPWIGQSILAAEEQLLEIGPADLRFSAQETECLLSRTDRPLETIDIDTLLDRTEGWPIAVQLASLSIKRGLGAERVIDEYCGSSSDLARYLSEQVLMTLPQETRDIVARTALVDRLTGEMVDLLCDRQDGWMVLERLEQQGVFLSPVSWERREYRYHQLFAEYLRDRFERSDRVQFAALQRRIASWHAERGQVAEAIHHAILSDDDMLVASILEDAGGWRLIPQGLQGIVVRGLSKLPVPLIRSRPRLALAHVYLQIKLGELGAARAELDHFLAHSSSADLSVDLKTEVRVVGDTLSDYENQPVTFDDLLAREALLRKLPANDHLVLANISETLGAKYLEGGWLERALQPTLAARDHYLAIGSVYSDLFTRFLEARIKRAQGRSKEAEAILASAATTITDNYGSRSDLAANCAAFQAELLFEQDLVAEARELLAWALPHMEQSDGWVDVYAAAYFTEARALAGEGSFEEACDLIDRARRVAARRRLRQLEMLADVCSIEVQISQGVPAHAVLAAAAVVGLDLLADMMHEESPPYRPVAIAASLCRTRLRLLVGGVEPALEELAKLRDWAEQHGAGRLLIDVNILTAASLRSKGEIEQARVCFDEAVGIAMFQNIVRPFVEARQFVQPCLDDALGADLQVDRFRAQFMKSLAKSLAVYRSNVTVLGMFSEAEAEVLLYLSQGHSNKEIARLIGMSPDTVKYRLKSVFRKIGVSKRRDAVRISAERGLIPAGSSSTVLLSH